MKKIGERIKKKRELLNLHLNELAEKVGVSPSALSQIEKSKSFPSILTLKSIAENLHTTIGDLVGENEPNGHTPVVNKNDIIFTGQNPSGTLFFRLAHYDTTNQMDAFLVRFTKASGIDGYFTNSIGQVFCHVLSGEIRFDLDGKIHLLKAGDNIYFHTKSSHNAINNNSGLSELLWMQSPPKL